MGRTARIGGLAAILLVTPVTVAAAAPIAARPTPDQVLVAQLEDARSASRSSLRRLVRPTPARVAEAKRSLKRAATAAAAAVRTAPKAVSALETPSVRLALERSAALTRQATAAVAGGRHAGARTRIQTTIALLTEALLDFGVPLEKDFAAFAVNRDFSGVPGFANYSGLTASAATEVTHIVIGAADRTTANAGEVRSSARAGEDGLPITEMSVYIIRDPIGRFTSNWCSLADGLITCRLRPTLRPDYTYTIAFGPKLERGTRLLVKFTAADGRRSYAVLSTR